jgi:hypothetical protein
LNWASGFTAGKKLVKISKVSIFINPRTRQVSTVLEAKDRPAIQSLFGDYFTQH